MSKRGDFVSGLIVGGLLGAVIGILYAPKSGKETREDIARKADEILAKAKEKVEEVEGLAERGKESFQDGKTRLKKAIEAGVEAFREEKSKAV
jgi:gas vesicle protein